MRPVVAYHVILCTHGFWLPNDPRGSGSSEVRYEPLLPFGKATLVSARQSVARKAHDLDLRRAAKLAMKYPEVFFTGLQALSVGNGFAKMVAKSGYRIHACSILEQHIHMVISRHHYPIEQVVRLLRQAGTLQLLADNRHPFSQLRAKNGRLPSVWQQDFWKVFLFDRDDVTRSIRYADGNPLKEGKPLQRWPFVVPYEG